MRAAKKIPPPTLRGCGPELGASRVGAKDEAEDACAEEGEQDEAEG